MDELNDILKQAAADYTLAPAPRVWEAVVRDIEKRERKKRIPAWWYWLLGLLMLAVLGYLLARPPLHPGKASPGQPGAQQSASLPDTLSENLPAKGIGTVQARPRIAAPAGHKTPAPRPGQGAAAARSANATPALRNTPLRMLSRTQATTSFSGTPIPAVPYTLPMRSLGTHRKALSIHASPRHTPGGMLDIPEQPWTPADAGTAEEARAATGLPLLPAGAPKLQAPPAASPQALLSAIRELPPAYEQLSPLEGSQVRLSAASPASIQVPENGAGPVPAAQITSTAAEQGADSIPREARKTGRWNISAGAFATGSWSRTESEHPPAGSMADSLRPRTEKLVAGGYQLQIHYQVKPFLEAGTGLGIYTFGERIHAMQQVPNRHTIPNSLGGTIPFLIGTDSSAILRNTFTYLEIPLNLKLRLITRRRLSLLLDAGISANKLLRSSGYAYDSLSNAYLPFDKQKAASWLSAYSAGLTLRYGISSAWAAEFQTWYRYYPEAVFRDDPNSTRRYYRQAGAGLMLRYSLGKQR